MKKATDLGTFRRFVLPSLALVGSAFMVIAAIFAHGIKPYLIAQASGTFSMPVLFYLILFAVILAVGMALNKKNK